MTKTESPLPLDPWTASSLLQKAIRRGDTDLAQWAAATLHRQRGASIWRRMVLVTYEDLGIGDIALVERVTTISTDRNARASLGSDTEIIAQLVAELAAAPKDRSADYLICTAIRNADLDEERAALAGLPLQEMIKIAATGPGSLVSRATAA